MVEQNESITRLYRIGHTEIEITAPLSMKSPRNLEKFRIGQAKRPDDEVIHYQVEMTENLDEIKEDLLGKKTGKSTQAGLWEKYRGTWTVNGDRSLLIREEDGWYANGWPVCGSSEICNNKSYPVRAIVMLSQAKENRISRLKGLEALRKVMEQITINAWNSEFQIQAMDELEILLKEVPVYHLECDISEDAVRCLEDVLAGGRGEE